MPGLTGKKKQKQKNNRDTRTSMMKKTNSSDRTEIPITIKHNGKSYTGKYWIEENRVCVVGYGSEGPSENCSPCCDEQSTVSASRLLRELAEAGTILPD
jgi:hypothetical protein